MLRSCLITLAFTLFALPGMAQESPPAEPSETAKILPPLDPRSELSANNLERQLPANEQQLLQVGDETVLALWRPANTAVAKGVVILLPDAGESADWPLVISPLRQRLPDDGWHSLSLTLPDLPELPLAATAEPDNSATDETLSAADSAGGSASTAPSTDSTSDGSAKSNEDALPIAEELSQAHKRQVTARLEAALAFAKTQEATEVVLLGHGYGAFWAMTFITEQKPSEVTRLLLIAPSVPPGFDAPIEEKISELQLPIGDFYYKDQELDRDQALLRLNSSKRNKQPSYTQVGLKALPGNREVEQEQLYRRIRGWLDKRPAPLPKGP